MMRITAGGAILFLGFSVTFSPISSADTINFDFTGRMTVADSEGHVVGNYDPVNDVSLPYTPIAATFSYNTESGVGGSSLSLTLGDVFFGIPGYFHDISMVRQPGSNLLSGNMLIDWAGMENMSANIEWDATGLLNAIDFGLQVGDKLSGTRLFRDSNGDGVWSDSELVVSDLLSSTPYSDVLLNKPWLYGYMQGPAPLAATSGSLGLDESALFLEGFVIYLDIGSGNSMYVTSISSVPVPAAAWLFGSGLLGLMGVCRPHRCSRNGLHGADSE
ncbi:MAG: hypothetical protein KKA36_08985 [Gammaproteobacteria bacterium]|nr:hypothetical protein [Gammaproteobacteria bacterium]MBU2479211.1 hypothetical protein [Gammaproteobacteria bacterium]